MPLYLADVPPPCSLHLLIAQILPWLKLPLCLSALSHPAFCTCWNGKTIITILTSSGLPLNRVQAYNKEIERKYRQRQYDGNNDICV